MTGIPTAELEAGLAVARTRRVAVFIVAYNAEAHIEETLRRIPGPLLDQIDALYVIDDRSTDATVQKARALQERIPKLQVYSTPHNQGYGGNQKIGYQHAIERGDDIVVLLHGDGQYAPEVLPRLLAPFESPETAAVMGSRILERGAARRGGMPLYKYWGNRVLTGVENRLMGASLSEWHSGYRAYRVADLAALPFAHNTSDFHFDTQILVQLLATRRKIVEVPIPTYYGDEICRVNGVAYAFRCVQSVLHYKITRLGLLYHPRYDLDSGGYRYKRTPNSLHQYVLRREFQPNEAVVDLGSGNGELAEAVHDTGVRVLAVDAHAPSAPPRVPMLKHDLDRSFADPVQKALGRRADRVLALDVLEHLESPEAAVREIHALLRRGGQLAASTGNIAYLPQRLFLLLGQFNYGKRGILDLTHRRLFTVASFKRLLEAGGFTVEHIRGFGPPIRDMVGQSAFLSMLDRVAGWLARLWPSMFAYQILAETRRRDGLHDLVEQTVGSGAPGEVAINERRSLVTGQRGSRDRPGP